MPRLLRKLENALLVGFATTLLGLILASNVCALECQPGTPCPCAADGTCRPQGPWGHSQTRWRPWPGDVIAKKPTSREEEEKQEQLLLEPYETPSPEKESLRGAETPESRKKKSSESNDDGPDADPLGGIGQDFGGPLPGELPAAQPQQPVAQPDGVDVFEMPGGADVEETLEDAPLPEEPLDDFDPFSNINHKLRAPKTAEQPATTMPKLPSSGPPSLPASLQKLSRSMGPTRFLGHRNRGARNQSASTVALAN